MILLLLACATSPDQPRAITWDHEICGQCGMTVSDPAFAVQLTTRDGESVAFDDPACGFQYVMEKHPSIGHMWFHDGSPGATPDAWLDWNVVEFVPATGAPMNGGFAASPLGTGGISFAAASTAILSRDKP